MAAPHFDSSVGDKAALRRSARERRDALPRDAAAGERLAGVVLAAVPPPPGAVVAGTWPIGSEIDPRPLLVALHARGHVLVLPLTPARGAPLRFLRWRPGDPLRAGPLGTREPDGGPEVAPDWLLVPLLAFDRAGRRLGYGGGYYDRTLAALPHASAIGCAFAAQEVPCVPAGAHDIRLARIATERGVIECGETA